MSNSILPVEILELIIETFISKFRVKLNYRGLEYKYTPYWQHHLTPVLRVCKYWHLIAEILMYQRVSVGSDFFVGTEKWYDRPEGRGHLITGDLLSTLTTNSRIATLVKDLQLAVYDVRRADALDYTRANLRILQLCPNVRHVEIKGFHHSESDALVEVLKAKSQSLLSLCISPHGVKTTNLHETSFKLLELMHCLPKLRTIMVRGVSSHAERIIADDPSAQTPPPGAPNCCPDLQDIRLVSCNIQYSDLESLLNMSDRVKYLSFIMKHGSGSEALLERLCRCLRGWSRTLERLSLDIDRQFVSYRPLDEALSILKGLRQLEVIGSLSYCSAAADLPSLERIRFKTDWEVKRREMDDFAAHLENSAKFPALKYVEGAWGSRHWYGYDRQLNDICSGRGIKLKMSNRKSFIPSYLW